MKYVLLGMLIAFLVGTAAILFVKQYNFLVGPEGAGLRLGLVGLTLAGGVAGMAWNENVRWKKANNPHQ